MQEGSKIPEVDVQAYHENEAMDARPLNGYQIAWMSHWKNSNSKSSTQDNNDLSIDGGSGREVREDSVAEQDNVPQGRSDASLDTDISTGAIREATKAAKVPVLNENLPENPRNLRRGSLNIKSFPVSEKRDVSLSLKGEQCAVNQSEVVKSKTATSFRNNNNKVSPKRSEIHFQSDAVSPPNLLMNPSNAIEKNKLTASAPVWSDGKPTSDMVLYAYNRGKSSTPTFTHGQHEIYQSSYDLASREHITSTNYQTYSSLLIREKRISNLLDPHTPGFSRFMSGGSDHAQYDPSASRSGGLNSDHHWKMQCYTGTAKFSSLTSPFESSKMDNFCHESSPVLQMPSSVHDAKTMKIFTASMESEEESSRGHPKICQTAHHFPMPENSDMILSERGKFFRDSVMTTNFKQNAFSEIPYISQPAGDNALRGLKLKTLGGFMNKEGKKSIQDLESMTIVKNESSAETDTMDMNALQEDQHPGKSSSFHMRC